MMSLEASPTRDIVLKAGRAEEYDLGKNVEEARKAYDALVLEASDFPNIHYAYGRFLLSTEEVEDARIQFKEEIKKNPRHVRARMQLATTYYRANSAEGIPYVQEVVKLKPAYPFGHYLLGLLYLTQGTYRQSVPQLETAARMVPREPQFQFALGNAYAKAGRKADAAKARASFRRLGGDGASSAGPETYGDERSIRLNQVPAPPLENGGDALTQAITRRRLFQALAIALPTCEANRSWGRAGGHPSSQPSAPDLFESIPPSVSGITWRHVNGRSLDYYLPETTGAGCAFLDFDNDGWMDIYLVNSGKCDFYDPNPPLRNALYRNNRDGTFSDVTEKAGVPGGGYGMGVAVGDYDHDGFPDIYVTQYGHSILYHNNGDGTFSDVTEKAGVAAPGWASSALGLITTTMAGSIFSFAALWSSTNPGTSFVGTKKPEIATTAYRVSIRRQPAGYFTITATALSQT